MRSTLYAAISIVFGMTAFAGAQDHAVKPQVPEEAFSDRELIAWSSLQKPQPTPQPLPPPDKAIPEPAQQRTSDAKSESGGTSEQTSVKTFVGTVVKQDELYVLRVAGGVMYRLENEGDAGQYENKSVKIFGELDGNTIHVTRIQVLS